jgi:hypothetical protein
MDPVCETGRIALRDTMAVLLVGFLALTGCTLLLAGVCVALVPHVGVAGALFLTGIAFLFLSALALLVRLSARGKQARLPLVEPQPLPQPDPLAQIIFDMSFNVGRAMRRRRY